MVTMLFISIFPPNHAYGNNVGCTERAAGGSRRCPPYFKYNKFFAN
ncbi:hypothetical protein I656_02036 [Geobacillus sp. WSUCF1]|nr:hypothetical protein I656_02036 [Geobacillus sp. WSUCF1]